MSFKRFFNWFFSSNKEKKIIVDCVDGFVGSKFTLVDLLQSLETRVERLEKENIETTNALYELENRLQAQIDFHHPQIYNMNDYSLGDK